MKPLLRVIAYFFAGVFLANCIPHLVNGITGHPFPTPFGTPPAVGLSPPTVNVLWGSFNLLVGLVLVSRVGLFSLRKMTDAVPLCAGFFLMAYQLAGYFGQLKLYR